MFSPSRFFFLIHAYCWFAATIVHSARVPVIIDTAVGSDFDDCVAISYALSRQDVFDIQLILSVTFNTTNRAVLIAKMLDKMNESAIDIGIGLPSPIPDGAQGGVGAQWPWAADYKLSDYPGPGVIYHDGVDRAIHLLQQCSPTNPMYIITLGPMSNYGQIFATHPELRRNAMIVAMSGSVYKGYGTDTPTAEYNVHSNVSAAEIIYDDRNVHPFAQPMCIAPLDTSYYFQIYGDNYQQILQSRELIPTVMLENFNVWYDNGGKNFGAYRPFTPNTSTSNMYNVQATWQASMLAEMDQTQLSCKQLPYMTMQALKIKVQSDAYTVIDNAANLTIVYESISWLGGDNDGTYPLGTYVANALTNPKNR